MNTLNGGGLMAQTLARLGVKHVFALHGGHLDSFLVAAVDEGLSLIDTRHEATCGHAADGYARVTGGEIGVAVITAGPGFTNGLTPMASAYLDAIPTLFFAGAPPLRETETNPLQGGFDQVAMAAPVCKWAHRVTHVERIPDLIEKAIRIAKTGRPGPVFLEVPIDIMFAPARPLMLPVEDRRAIDRLRAPAPSGHAVAAMLEMLASAERPVIIAGGGTILSPSSEPLMKFAEASGIPVVANGRAHGVLRPDHPNNCGGVDAVGVAALSGTTPDVVLLAGARQGLFTGGRSGGVIPPDAKLIQIDTDANELGRLQTPDIPVIADCAESFKALAEGAREKSWRDYAEWRGILQNAPQAVRSLFEDAAAQSKPNAIHPYHAAKAAMGALRPETAIVCDGGEAVSWATMHLRVPAPGRFMANGYLGCLGIGPGMAIGAATAEPDRPVAVVMGDGAVGFNIQEFDTMVRHELPILTMVFNNSGWGMSRNGQDLVFGPNRRSAVALSDTNYDQVAKGFGAEGERIERFEDIAPAIEQAQASGRPTCLNIITDPDIAHPVTASMIGDVAAENEIAIPYYENIPI